MSNKHAVIINLLAAAALAVAGCGTKKSPNDSIAGPEASGRGSETTGSEPSPDLMPEPASTELTTKTTDTGGSADDLAPPPIVADAERKDRSSRTRAAGLGKAPAAPRGIRPSPYKRRDKPRERPRDPGVSMPNSEVYEDYGKNPFIDTDKDNLSTFAVDVDTASYAIARRKIVEGSLPPASAVRVEEFVNYFKYDYDGPTDGAPFAVHMDAAPSPFSSGKHILRVGVQAKKLSIVERKKANLVFLVDVSGSMSSPDKLPLAKRSLRLLVSNLKDGDTVSLVTYAGSTRVVLKPTDVAERAAIVSAIEDLTSGGGTAMGSGIDLAYDLAAENLSPDTVSRVIVLSDGDANIGRTGHREILAQIKGKVKEGVTLSTIGLGMGNYKDTMMEQLANKGNGNYYYIDTFSQAKRVFQEQLGGTLEVVAKDVKIQVDFDTKAVKRYRLVGYENRDIADHDFRNDKVDAGEIGAGHTVTAIYEVELGDISRTLATVRVRNKKPRGTKASERAFEFNRDKLYGSFDSAPADFRFATAVMATAELLRRSEHAKEWSIDRIIKIAKNASAADDSERQELISLVEKIRPMRNQLARR